jgi:hypothetical protein
LSEKTTILPCDHFDMAFPPPTHDHQRRLRKQFMRPHWISTGLYAVGILLIVAGLEKRTGTHGVVWTGVAVLGFVMLGVAATREVLLSFRSGRAAKAAYEKDLALREPGTVELSTIASSPFINIDTEDWELRTNMQVCLDSGQTFSGSYYTFRDSGPGGHRATVRPFDSWFRVGANLRCLANPTNSHCVWVFPFAAPGEPLRPPPLKATRTPEGFVSFSSYQG